MSAKAIVPSGYLKVSRFTESLGESILLKTSPHNTHNNNNRERSQHLAKPERLVLQKRHGAVVTALGHGCGDVLAVVERFDDERPGQGAEGTQSPPVANIAEAVFLGAVY